MTNAELRPAFPRARNRLRAWAFLALALFAFESLSPALAALAGSQAKSHFVEICTIEGLKRVAVNEDPAGSNELAFKCPVCTLSAGHAAIDARVPLRFEAIERASERLPERIACAAAPYRAIAPPPRGPPSNA